ncbi:hypothetical protein EVAR_37417_1 [Eumeta japonica]|uniref:Uncharacterized protein n=1 Tax=Eumeta variegata TaxID=151549 RepID=A0A4C1WHQ0_EUMVA|nr:hypothetical protein EVAR_37417_1 [Eumeta japonica]
MTEEAGSAQPRPFLLLPRVPILRHCDAFVTNFTAAEFQIMEIFLWMLPNGTVSKPPARASATSNRSTATPTASQGKRQEVENGSREEI